MATQLQIRRGTSSQVAAFTGAVGELVVNTTNDSVHVNDGSTAGGFELARVDGSNWANITTTANIDVGTVTADGLTVEKTSSGANVSVASLQNDGSGANTKADLDFHAANTKYATISGGYGASAPELDIKVGNTPSKIVTFTDGGDVSFYEDTGTTPKMFWDASSERLGIGTTSPASLLTIQDATPVFEIDSTTSSNTATIQFTSSGTVDSKITHVGNTGVMTIDSGRNSSWGGKIAFVTDTVERMRIDNSGNVTVQAAGELRIRDDGTFIKEDQGLQIGNTSGTGTTRPIRFFTESAERMRIDSGGGINKVAGSGATLPAIAAGLLTGEFKGSADSAITNDSGFLRLSAGGGTTVGVKAGIDIFRGSTDGSLIRMFTSGSERLRVDSSGNVGIGTSSPRSLLDLGSGSDGTNQISWHTDSTTSYGNIWQSRNGARTIIANGLKGSDSVNNGFEASTSNTWGRTAIEQDYGVIRFYTNAATATTYGASYTPSERMQIDSSGNLLVGTTSVPSQNTGVSSGVYFVVKGDIIPAVDAGLTGHSDLGDPSTRYEDAYVRDGVTTGSDGRDKQDIEELSDAEQRVAVACKGLLRKWRWKSSVAEKGDEARIHFGIIAQDLQAAFEAEGLDAGRYAMFINSTWTDEDTGEERTRMGVRYSELLAFIIAAI